MAVRRGVVRTSLGIALTALLFAGPVACANPDAGSRGGVAAVRTPSAGPSTQTSATTRASTFVQYPDGVRVTLLRVTTMPDRLQSKVCSRQLTAAETTQTLRTVTIRIENHSPSQIPLDTTRVDVLVGVHRQKADHDPGCLYDKGAIPVDDVVQSNDPAQVDYGQTIEIKRSFDLPRDEHSGAVRLDLRPGVYAPFTFGGTAGTSTR
jgi:hypothetical protein